MSGRTWTLLILVIVVLAAAVRVAVWHDFAATPFGSRAIEDEEFYDGWANRILEGEPDPAVYHMSPLPAYVLALEYRLLGRDLTRVRLVGVLAGLVGVWLAALAGREAFGARAGILSAALAASYAPEIFYECSLLPIAWTSTLAFALVFLVMRADRDRAGGARAWPWALAGGAVLGVLVLLRGNALALVPALAIVLAVRARRQLGRARGSRWLAAPLALLAGAVLPIAPITVHNVRGGDAVLLTWHVGQNLHIGNHAGATGLYVPLRRGRHAPDEEREDARALAEAALARELSPGEISTYWTSRALAFAAENPGEFATLSVRKLRHALNAYELPDAHDFYYLTDRSVVLRKLPGFGLLFPLALAGVVLARRERAFGVLATSALVYLAGVAAAFVFGRYRLPLAAFLVPLAAAGVDRTWEALRNRRSRALVVPALAAAAAAVLAAVPIVPRAYGLASTYFNAGRVHELDGETEAAHEAYTRAVGYNAAHAKSLRGIVRTGLVLGRDPSELLEQVDRALALESAHPSSWVLRGDVLLELDRIEDARRAYLRAVRIVPRYAPALEGLERARARALGG